MATEEFTWCPDNGADGDVGHRRLEAKFGDGYMQVAGDGINTRTMVWNLKFERDQEVIYLVKDFLDRHAGVKPFYWQPPLGKGQVPVGRWRKTGDHRETCCGGIGPG